MNALLLAIMLTIPGDVNQSGSVNITDVMALVDYIFNGIEPPRTEWVEVDTTVSVVWILDRAFLTAEWPVVVQNHFYVTVDDSGRVDTTVIREYKITEATYPSGNELIRTR